jgi:hypothetical protein
MMPDSIDDQSYRLLQFFSVGCEYQNPDVIEVETNEDKLWFRNETNKKEFKMKIRLTEDEWQQACFCVQLIGKGNSVSIQPD